MFSNFFSKHEHRSIFAVMCIGAIMGLLASFVLSTEAITLAKNSSTVLPCDINSALSCGAVGRHPSASVFGFPNAFIGMISFSVLLAVAVAGLMGTKLPKLYMYLAWLGAVGGGIFAVWMFMVSYMVIGVLCPWCLTTDVATLLILWSLTRYNIRENNLYLRGRAARTAEVGAKKGMDTLLFVSIAAIALLMIVLKFGNQLF
jgi:uncharacterized membrane protein